MLLNYIRHVDVVIVLRIMKQFNSVKNSQRKLTMKLILTTIRALTVTVVAKMLSQDQPKRQKNLVQFWKMSRMLSLMESTKSYLTWIL